MNPDPGPLPGGRPGLSACIIAFNEADRIGACIESLSFCDEVLVVDSHSTDKTREIAAGLGARVIERDWPGHVAQKEFAIRAANHDWVLCVDADERISPPLRGEIEALAQQGFQGFAGWDMPRLSSYLGRFIRHGTWYPDRSLRLFDRRRGAWGGYNPHDKVELAGPRGRAAAHASSTSSPVRPRASSSSISCAEAFSTAGAACSWPCWPRTTCS